MTYRLKHVSINNFKRISKAELEIGPSLTIIGGRNAQGKTSAIDAIMTLLFGAKYAPTVPVKVGETSAHIVGTIETPSGELTVKRIFRTDGSDPFIEVSNAEGMKSTAPQRKLNEIFNLGAVDPLRFADLPPKEQVAELQKILGIDLTEINSRQANAAEERKSAKRTAQDLEGMYRQLPELGGDIPDQEISVSSLAEQLSRANQTNGQREQMATEINVAKDRIEDMLVRISNEETQLAETQRRIDEMKAKRIEVSNNLEARIAQHDAFELIDIAPIQSAIDTAEETNRKVRAKAEREERRNRWADAKAKADAADLAVKAIEDEKRKVLTEVKWPVEGLSFGEDGVQFNGLPFSQASSAERLRVSVPIAFALAPQAPFAVIRDGSLLDDESLQLVAELTTELGGQLIIERVGEDDGALIFENGTLVEGKVEA
jgi:predicted ATP-dependent endonuclease of OLD family